HPRPHRRRARGRGGRLAGGGPARGLGGIPRLHHPGGAGGGRARRRPPRAGAGAPDPGGGGGIRRCPRPGAAPRLGFAAVDLELSDEQRLISEAAREFAEREVVPRGRGNDRAGRFDRDLAHKLGDVGYLGAPVAEEYGGRGLDYIGYGLIVEQVGRADSSARTVVSVQTSLVCGSIELWGSEEQKRKWLPRLCSGEALGCFGLTEPDAGSDPSGMRT